MNLKKKRILALIGVGLISALTSFPTLKDANAALTAPASYDYSYTYDGAFTYELNTSPSYVYYTRTSDGIYYNYTSTFEIVDGLEITHTFNRSNTSWTFISGSPGGYTPTDTKIGSNNLVGSISQKIVITIDNQTNKDYALYLDYSSTASSAVGINLNYNNGLVNSDLAIRTDLGGYQFFIISSYSTNIIRTNSTSGVRYFDAWYLKDLGVSAAYNAGLDDGYVVGQDDADLLVTGFSAMVGILVNFVLMIANLEVLGVSLMGILTIIILFAGIVWTLKLIRG